MLDGDLERGGGVAGGGGFPEAMCRDLSPILSPSAWYVTDPIDVLVDQSGNGYTLTQVAGPTALAGPDLGQVGLRSGKWSYNGANVANWRITTPLSVVALRTPNAQVGDSWIAACENAGGGFPTWWKFGVQWTGAVYRFIAAWDNAGVSYFTAWGDGMVPSADYHVIGFSREADGITLRGYVDGLLVASGTATQPSGPTGANAATASLYVGQDAFGVPNVDGRQVIALKLGGWSSANMRAIAKRLLGI